MIIIPSKAYPADLSLSSDFATKPTRNIPVTIKTNAIKWWGYYFLLRNINDNKAVIIAIDPLIIW